MKTILLILSIAVLFITACNKENVQPEPAKLKLPKAIDSPLKDTVIIVNRS